MSRLNRGTESKPYNPADDPYFIPVEHVYSRNYTGGLAFVVTFGGAGTIIVRKLGWAGLIGVIAVAALAVIVWLLIRRSLIKVAAEPGHVNRHDMTTRECITPREKKLRERFYTMDCGYCGKSTNVQAVNLRRKKCPHCGSRKPKY